MPKRRSDERGGGGGSRAEPRQQHLYLVIDDWDCGYSIRKVKFPFPSASSGGNSGADEQQRLPHPFMRLVADRGLPDYFTSAFSTKIMGLHANGPAVQIIDVHTRSVLFGPSSNYPAFPIYFPIGGDKLIAMDTTFAFDTRKFLWTRLGEWRLPFTGRGHFDSDLHALVGLDSENLGYLVACDVPSTNRRCPVPAWKRSKDKVFSEDPGERHVGATLVYMGRRRKFCLVECVSVEAKGDNADQMLLEKPGAVPQRSRYMYRLMTFTLKYDKMDDLRVKHGRVQYYKVPKKATTDFVCADPVAFWL
nr:unnamed protein product [Digitaria exilis]